MNLTVILTSAGCFGLFVIFGLVMFWVYGLTPILHWIIKSNGVPARGVVLEVKKAGWGWYSGGEYSQSLVFQPVRVKLEVHPNEGAPYIVTDRFNASPKIFHEKLKPGAEMNVLISSFGREWVASLPDTIIEAPAQTNRKNLKKPENVEDEDDDSKNRLIKLKSLLNSDLITQQEYEQKKKEILEEM